MNYIHFAQLLAVEQIGIAYVCSDFFLCILNLHALYQFRMMQREISRIWSVIDEQTTNVTAYTRGCHVALKKCIRRHQSLIEFCNKLEQVFTFPILSHVVVFSLLMCFDTYEILLVIFLLSFPRIRPTFACQLILNNFRAYRQTYPRWKGSSSFVTWSLVSSI